MSDFSLFSLFTAGLAFASGVAAYTQPVGSSPVGNPISEPGKGSVVPAGKPFTVTWDPTTAGTVTLVLLKGPSTNAEPQYAIVENIENDGSYIWVPSKDLAPTSGAEGYGIQLIDDATGQYQYTTQFGISNPSYDGSSSSSSSSVTVSAAAATTSSSDAWPSPYSGHGGWGHGSHNVHGGWTHSGSATASGMTTSMSTTSMMSNGTTTSAGYAKPTGFNSHNVTMVQPTGSYQTSKTAQMSGAASTPAGSGAGTASTPVSPQATGNGAATVVSSLGSLVLAAGAAVLVL